MYVCMYIAIADYINSTYKISETVRPFVEFHFKTVTCSNNLRLHTSCLHSEILSASTE